MVLRLNARCVTSNQPHTNTHTHTHTHTRRHRSGRSRRRTRRATAARPEAAAPQPDDHHRRLGLLRLSGRRCGRPAVRFRRHRVASQAGVRARLHCGAPARRRATAHRPTTATDIAGNFRSASKKKKPARSRRNLHMELCIDVVLCRSARVAPVYRFGSSSLSRCLVVVVRDRAVDLRRSLPSIQTHITHLPQNCCQPPRKLLTNCTCVYV